MVLLGLKGGGGEEGEGGREEGKGKEERPCIRKEVRVWRGEGEREGEGESCCARLRACWMMGGEGREEEEGVVRLMKLMIFVAKEEREKEEEEEERILSFHSENNFPTPNHSTLSPHIY